MKTLANLPRLIIMMVLLVALVLSGCKKESLTAEEILAQSRDKMEDVKSMRMEMNIVIQAGGTNLTITADAVTEQPDRAYIEMSVMGQKVEVLTMSKTEIYLKQPGSAAWEPVPADQIAEMGLNMDIYSQLNVNDIASNIKKAGDEEIDGTDCYHITFDVDAEKYLQGSGQMAGVTIDPASTTATGEIWIGKSDLLNRQLDIQLTTTIQGMSTKMGTTITMSGFNEPVDIPTP